MPEFVAFEAAFRIRNRHAQRLASLLARQVEHAVHHDRFANRPQAARAELVLDRLIDNVIESVLVERQFDAVHFEQLDVLARNRVFRLGQNRAQRNPVERFEVGQHRNTPDQLGDQSERFEILRHDIPH